MLSTLHFSLIKKNPLYYLLGAWNILYHVSAERPRHPYSVSYRIASKNIKLINITFELKKSKRKQNLW